MKTVKILFVLQFFLSVFSLSHAQLSEDWYGSFEGTLEVLNYKGETSEVEMKVSIQPKTDSSYSFELTYGKDTTEQVRSYELVHDKGNQFVMDEKNGILLPLMLFNNRLISVFEVEGNLLQVSYTLDKRRLIFRTISSKKSNKSGGQGNIPVVQGYLPYVYQFAPLNKL